MKAFPILVVCLVLVYATAFKADASQKATPIALSGETVLAANSGKLNVKVTFKTRKVDKKIDEDWNKKLSFVPSTCTYSSWCSIVEKIDILVNGKEVFAPHAIISDLANISNAEIRFEGANMMLILQQGDVSEYCLVKIEFDRKHVKRMSIFADDSMAKESLLQESNYYLVVIN